MSDEHEATFEWWELTDEALAELAAGQLRRVKTPDGRVLLMTKEEIRTVIEHALADHDETTDDPNGGNDQ